MDMNYYSESKHALVDIDQMPAPYLLSAIKKLRRTAQERNLTADEQASLDYMVARADREGFGLPAGSFANPGHP